MPIYKNSKNKYLCYLPVKTKTGEIKFLAVNFSHNNIKSSTIEQQLAAKFPEKPIDKDKVDIKQNHGGDKSKIPSYISQNLLDSSEVTITLNWQDDIIRNVAKNLEREAKKERLILVVFSVLLGLCALGMPIVLFMSYVNTLSGLGSHSILQFLAQNYLFIIIFTVMLIASVGIALLAKSQDTKAIDAKKYFNDVSKDGHFIFDRTMPEVLYKQICDQVRANKNFAALGLPKDIYDVRRRTFRAMKKYKKQIEQEDLKVERKKPKTNVDGVGDHAGALSNGITDSEKKSEKGELKESIEQVMNLEPEVLVGNVEAFLEDFCLQENQEKDLENLTNLLGQKYTEGRNIAHHQANKGHVRVLKWLDSQLEHKNLLSKTDTEGRNIAHYAARGGHKNVLQWIAKHEQLKLLLENKSPDDFLKRYGRQQVAPVGDSVFASAFSPKKGGQVTTSQKTDPPEKGESATSSLGKKQ